MTQALLKDEVIQSSPVIINGYAIQPHESGFRVINIHRPDHVTLFSANTDVLETCMDDIEIEIARRYLLRGLPYLEEDDAEVL